MSDVSELVEEREKEIKGLKDFPIILVKSIRRKKGRKTTVKKLPDNLFYHLRVHITDTYRITYNYLRKEEIYEKIKEWIVTEDIMFSQ
jgi:SNF2 family DNA or RNA helicase